MNKKIPMNIVRRVSYVFLCIVPFLSFVVGGLRALRVPGIYQGVGVAYFAAIVIAVWTLGSGAIRADVQGRRLLGLAGTLLVTPFALVALLWVGLGPPWQATPAENQMRYLVLFVAGFLTYLATAAFAASVGRVQWLGRGATRAFMIVNGVALLFLVIRGVQFPDPKSLSAPWYTSPGFVVGIPAVPFIMPFLLGVVLLRRAGEEKS